MKARPLLPLLLLLSCSATQPPANRLDVGSEPSLDASAEVPADLVAVSVELPSVEGAVVDYVVGLGSCVVLASGSVTCWGRDPETREVHREGRAVPGVSDAVAFGHFGYGPLAVLHQDGSVTDLASGERIKSTSKVAHLRGGWAVDTSKAALRHYPPGTLEKVTGLPPVLDVAQGEDHRCVVLVDGTVRCRGSNGRGQLGTRDGARQAVADMPTAATDTFVPVPGLSGAKAVAAGSEHSCALLESGRVECWGSGYQGNTGPGGRPERGERVAIPGIDDALEIAAAPGGWTTCVTRAAGVVSCWGWTGEWSRRAGRAVVDLPPLDSPRGLQVGRTAVCVMAGPLGQVQCLGNPPALGPVVVAGVTEAVEVVVNHDQSCARTRGGDVLCWGHFRTSSGGVDTDRFVVTPALELSGTIDIDGGRTPSRLADVCAVTKGGSVTCLGPFGRPARTVPGISEAEQITVGQYHLCVRTTSGRVQCWGSNDRYQRGHADREVGGDPEAPANTVAGLPPVSLVAAGGSATCAIAASDGQVYCWGDGERLGDGSGEGDHRPRPGPVSGLHARHLALSFSNACAVTLDRQVVCWGNNFRGLSGAPTQIGDPDYQLHVDTPHALDIVADEVVLGGPSCAVRGAGQLRCWTRPGERISLAVEVDENGRFFDWSLSPFRSLTLGENHGCLAAPDGSVVCFGSDEHGAVGRGGLERWLPMVNVESL